MNEKDYHYTGYNKRHLLAARQLRKAATNEEKKLWYDFLANYPVRFIRQRPIDGYIVDFYSSKARLVIEADGSQHYTEHGWKYDGIRTEVLEKYGLAVIRYSNREINDSFRAVRTDIDQKTKNRLQELQTLKG
ncbi:MAG: DUF559 domain-containing protein [Clostridia bacterium]|nr:DUF559 domain-containing protein [Clostridia bacterium]